MYKATISFDISNDFILARIGESCISSTNTTMTLEVHPTFFMTSKNPATFNSARDFFRNALLMDDIDMTEHLFDLECVSVDANTTSGTNNIMLADIDIGQSISTGEIMFTQSIRKPCAQYYYPRMKSCHVEGSYIFGMPPKMPVDNQLVDVLACTPIYIGAMILYNYNVQDIISKTTTNTTNIGYFMLPASMTSSGGSSITLEVTKGGSVSVQPSSSEGLNNICSLNNIALSVSYINRRQNLDQ